MGINKKILAIMAEVGSIGKDSENTMQKYSFRSADAVLGKLQPLFVKHGVIFSPNVRTQELSERVLDGKDGKTQVVTGCHSVMEYTLTDVDSGEEKVLSMGGYGVDYSDKPVNKAQTAALKYVLCETFLIPYGEDGDEDSPSHAPKSGVGSQRPAGWKPEGEGQQQSSRSSTTGSTPEWKVLQSMACPGCGEVGKVIRSKQNATQFYCLECKTSSEYDQMAEANDDFTARVSK